MKKNLLLIVLCIGAFSFYCCDAHALEAAEKGTNTPSVPYACEEDLIEVMFAWESRVRMQQGLPVDLATRALQGVDDILAKLAWHTWFRLTEIPESLIDSWEINGERNTGEDLYNLNNIYRLKIPSGNDVWKIAAQLEALPGVLLARPVPKPMKLPSPGNYQSQQGYLSAATSVPAGIDALYAWGKTGGTGAGITICDLEYSWNYNHADIAKAVGSQINPNPYSDPYNNNNHGTAVIGTLVADNNGWGTTGICYGSSLKTCATYYNSAWNIPGAMAMAIAALTAGDIIIIEQQWEYTYQAGNYIPIEWWMNYSPASQSYNAVYAAIVTAVANGIHVVEAGGNGNINTGAMTWYGNSGAIIVGAGGATISNDRTRLSFSSYGPRFDLQGWGENVVTTGYGDLYSAQGVNYYYTSIFNGTSSASPVVAGALACAEGYYLANVSAVPPTPSFMRSQLALYSTAQVTPPTGNIGPRPNLKAFILANPPASPTLDFGDAPDLPYPTLTTTNGARHTITGLALGVLVDAEMNGQPNGTATGDDIVPATSDDEDGVIFTSLLTPGLMATVQVIASAPGVLNAWMDFNKANVWGDPGEFIFQNILLTAGPNFLAFQVPASAMPGFTYARFRFNSQGGLLFYGAASDGEVEDYQVFIQELPPTDWGDAPDPTYPTLGVSNGASHVIDNITFLGNLIDPEPDGQPDPMALGDDLDIFYPPPVQDEDGVAFMWPLAKGNPCKLKVTASVGDALFNAWIDFNGNGSWADPGEHVFMDINILTGVNYLTFVVPQHAVPGTTFARFRFSHQPALSYTGQAFDGEVEDYKTELISYSEMKWHQPPAPNCTGIHATDANIVADDWRCNGEVVTDLHWWGNYELNAAGGEKKGGGINHFLLTIYSNYNCLPYQTLKTYTVPFVPGLEIPTGLNNSEGSPIYKYDFMLPEPFIQVEDSTCWFSVQAISQDLANPPSWRWQEANRWLFPILCGAASQSAPGAWQTILWPFSGLVKYSDMAFDITSWVVDTLYLQNIDVTNGQALCYDANYVISVAGSGTTFTVQSGSSATMIAGLKILYLPGTHAKSGSYMHGYITNTGQFCPRAPVLTGTVVDPALDLLSEFPIKGSDIKVYPNPTSGTLTLEMLNKLTIGQTVVEIYGMMGERISRQVLPAQPRFEISLSLQPPGVYILKVFTGNEARMVKVVKW